MGDRTAVVKGPVCLSAGLLLARCCVLSDVRLCVYGAHRVNLPSFD